MLDPQSITYLIVGSVIVGIISAAIPSGIGKIIALLGSFPLVFLLITAAVLGTTITEISDSIILIQWFIENFVPLIIGYAFEGAGITIVKAIKKAARID